MKYRGFSGVLRGPIGQLMGNLLTSQRNSVPPEDHVGRNSLEPPPESGNVEKDRRDTPTDINSRRRGGNCDGRKKTSERRTTQMMEG